MKKVRIDVCEYKEYPLLEFSCKEYSDKYIYIGCLGESVFNENDLFNGILCFIKNNITNDIKFISNNNLDRTIDDDGINDVERIEYFINGQVFNVVVDDTGWLNQNDRYEDLFDFLNKLDLNIEFEVFR